MARPSVERLVAAFRDACEAAGLRQEQIADAVGVHQTTVSKWLLGKTQPPLEHLPTIEELCGLPHGRLLRIAGFVEPDTSVPAAIAADPLLDDSGRELVAMAYDYCVQAALNADRPSVMPSRAVQEAEAAADKATAERLAAEREPNHSPSAAAG